jgi:hypothetical protein
VFNYKKIELISHGRGMVYRNEQVRETLSPSIVVIPAKAGIQSATALDTGLRRCDEFHHWVWHLSP